jgi:prepilin-type N-terminal cleavage/methylation domain-containing protein
MRPYECRSGARSRGARRAVRAGGFSLIEILVALALISLVAGALAPYGFRSVRAAQMEKTRTRMDAALRGLVGDPERGDFGYLGDLGALPPTLDDLNDATGKPAWALNASDGVGYGWAGPYAPSLATAGTALVDAWGMTFQYTGAAQLRSAGPDRAYGNADDLLRPQLAQATTGSLVVTVLGIPSGGGTPIQLDTARVDVFVASAAAGLRSEQALSGAGPYTASNLHLGLHAVRAVGVGAWAAAPVVRDVVAIKRGASHRTLVLEQP